ncbi:hypothetical protein GS438_26170 [Rhodococcus hoagii]|nr:hypothetical protein [Prescottella equi]
MQAFGWTLTDIGARIGMAETNIAALQHQRRVSYSLWMRIREVYEELSSTPGPSDDSRRRASRKGWLNPFEWEGYDIDDPRVTHPGPPARRPIGAVHARTALSRSPI